MMKGDHMKSITRRIVASFCALALSAAFLPLPARAETLSYSDSYDIANGLRYTVASSENGSLRQQSFRLEYTPGSDVFPIVAYGSKLYGKSSIEEIVDYVENQGQSVYGAANADFFVLSTGLPSGLVVNNGRLVSSDGMWNAVGVKPDGRMIVGAPQMAMSLYSSITGDYPVYALNKQRSGAGIYLLNSDFSSQTRSTGIGVNVVLTPVNDEPLKIGQEKQFVVTAVNRDVSGSTPIGDNEYILTASNTYSNRGYTISSLQVGETVTFKANVYNEDFTDAVYACGAGDMAVKNGVMQSGLSSSSNPRTLLGVRPDGSAVALVADGRQEISQGMSVKNAAQLLLNKGCTNVVNLDGGGSSAEVVRQPGSKETEVVNSPSDGSLRKCANYLLFVNTATPTGEETGAFVYPHSVATLSGAQVSLGANTFDQHYYPVSSYYSGFRVTSPTEQVLEGNVFTAPQQAGEYLISLDHETAASMPASITVYQQPDRVVVKNKSGTTVTSLSMDVGGSIDLDIDAYAQSRILYEQDNLFTWQVTGNAGTITQDGVFTASKTTGASGNIVISHNGFSVSIPVRVGKMPSILEDYEDDVTYYATADTQDISARAQVTHSLDQVRYGSGALSMTYKGASSMDKAHAAVFTAASSAKLSGAKNLTFYAKASPGKSMYINFLTSSGSTVQRAFYAGEDWTLVTVEVPSGATAVKGFSTSVSPGQSGNIYIDQLVVHYAAAQPDVTPPEITMPESVTSQAFSATVKDATGFAISSRNISLTYDGKNCNFTYNSQTGALSATLPENTGGLHRLTLEATDPFGNIARKSMTLGTSGGATPYEDMNGHWAQDYAEFLRVQGIFSTDSQFMPQNNTTNEMAATLLSRYLGIDTDDYADVKLPYTDASQISDWALPHVKALYAQGIMIGSTDGKGNSVFLPSAPVSRAQVMTLLGRTLERGYAYSNVSFDDAGDIPAWASDHVKILSSLGIVQGYGGTNSLKPLNSITRAEFASLLFKLY